MLGRTGVIFIGLIATLLLFLFVILFFAFWNVPTVKILKIKNDTGITLNILLSSTLLSGETTKLQPIQLDGGQDLQVTLYPGSIVYVQAKKTSEDIALTTVILATGGHLSSGQISVTAPGTSTQTVWGLITTGNDLDYYGVSMQSGYNVRMVLAPINKPTTEGLSCQGQNWVGTLECPDVLKDGIGCQNPCSLGVGYCSNAQNCRNTYPNLDYYNVFADACPACMVTQCDPLNFSCSALEYELRIF